MAKIIALKPNVNVRRGINTGAGILGQIKNGEQLEMVGDLIPGAGVGESWAQVIWKDKSIPAYVCVTLPGGAEMCRVDGLPPIPPDYARGYNDGLDAAIMELVKLRK